MITRESLLENGYKAFQQRNIKEFTTSFFQKRFDDAHGKRFYVTIAEYSNKELQKRGLDIPDFSYAPEVQFTSGGKHLK